MVSAIGHRPMKTGPRRQQFYNIGVIADISRHRHQNGFFKFFGFVNCLLSARSEQHGLKFIHGSTIHRRRKTSSQPRIGKIGEHQTNLRSVVRCRKVNRNPIFVIGYAQLFHISNVGTVGCCRRRRRIIRNRGRTLPCVADPDPNITLVATPFGFETNSVNGVAASCGTDPFIRISGRRFSVAHRQPVCCFIAIERVGSAMPVH